MVRHLMALFIVGSMVGCSAVNEINEDYLNADDPERQSFGEAMDTLKTDYLGAKENLSLVNKKAEVIAYNTIMETSYKDGFEIYKPKLDNDPGMPRMKPYLFVNFPPKKGIEEYKGFTYLVVVKILNDKVLFSGLYSPPGGDPFYRYNEVINKIENK